MSNNGCEFHHCKFKVQKSTIMIKFPIDKEARSEIRNSEENMENYLIRTYASVDKVMTIYKTVRYIAWYHIRCAQF